MWLSKQLTIEDLAQLAHQPPVCDFCGVHAPGVVYASSVTSGGADRMCWRWCACPDCQRRVEAGAWHEIVEEIAKSLMHSGRSLGPVFTRLAAMRALHEFQLFAVHVPQETEASHNSQELQP